MDRRALQGLVSAFVAAVCVASCSGGNNVLIGGIDGGDANGGGEASTHKDGGHGGKGDSGHGKGDGGHAHGDGGKGDDGGPVLTEAGGGCTGASECASGVCTAGVCEPPSPTDGVKNDSETDTDCGGSASPSSDGAPACANGKTCLLGSDCTSQSCQAGVCVPPTCMDMIADGQETDTDCGGPSCAACPAGDKCKLPGDCVSDVCTGGVCQAATDTDGVKNDSETDTDCGGALLASGQPNASSDGAPVCAVGKQCKIGQDCAEGVCAAFVVLDGGVATDASASGDGGAVLLCQPASPTDGVKNDSESDVDCGGGFLAGGAPNPASDGAPACAATKACVLTTDCQSLVCTAGVCQAPDATDGVKNDSETDTDCGGALLAGGQPNASSDGAPACAFGKSCLLGNDCQDLVCATSPVTTPSPDGSPINCPAGQTCTCQKAAPNDGVKNDSETDIDCGGAVLASGQPNMSSDGAPVCQFEKDQHCLLGVDCDSGVCNANAGAGGGPVDCPAGATCACQPPAKNDTVKNDSETDVDCGGALLASGQPNTSSDGAPVCAVGKECLLGNDCAQGVCNANGGAGGGPVDCPAGKSCVCQAAAPNDGVKNDSETDVDCGGKGTANSDNAPACADDKDCKADADCKSGYCSSLSHTCVDGASCKGAVTPALANGEHAGLDTCGKGETSDVGHTHESCCRSLLLPSSTTVRLDKYEVTAGRIRQFVESVSAQMMAENPNNPPYDIRDWAIEQIADATPIGNTLKAQIPTGVGTTVNVINLLPQTYYGALNIIEQLGGTSMDANTPSAVQGCYVNDGAEGASTYWWPVDDPNNDGIGLDQVGSPARPYAQSFYDVKPMNCGTYWIYAAFCAWDGGFLPTIAQMQQAYGGGQYPWTTTTGAAAPFLPSPYPVDAQGHPNIPQPAVDNTVNWNNDSFAGLPGDFYFFPNGGGLGVQPAAVTSGLDYSPFIAAPGRFYKDATLRTSASFAVPETWQDLGANVMEISALANPNAAGGVTFCDCGAQGPGDANNCTCPSAGDPSSTCAPVTGAKTGVKCGTKRGTTLPTAQWEGGSWEGHTTANPASKPYFGSATYVEPLQTQYGKLGVRCARNAEP